MKEVFVMGHVPIASHVFYTDALNDDIAGERYLGMMGGFALGDCAEGVLVGLDLGISSGMERGLEKALTRGQAISGLTLDVTYWELLCQVLFPYTMTIMLCALSLSFVMLVGGFWCGALELLAVFSAGLVALYLREWSIACREMRARRAENTAVPSESPAHSEQTDLDSAPPSA